MEPCNHSVSGDGVRVHANESQDDTNNSTQSKDGSKEDDKDHDVIATNIGGDREEDHANEGDSGCHHCSGVEDARKGVNHPRILNVMMKIVPSSPLSQCQVMLMLYLEC